MNTEPKVSDAVTELDENLSLPQSGLSWTKIGTVFLVGITLGAMIPVGMKFTGHWPSQSQQEVQVVSQAVEKPVRAKKAEKSASTALVMKVEETNVALKAPANLDKPTKKASKKPVSRAEAPAQQRLAAKSSVAEGNKATAAIETSKARVEAKAAPTIQKSKPVAKIASQKVPAVVLEEVPTAPSAQQIETLMQNQRAPAQKLAKPVALPAGAGLSQVAELNKGSEKPLPIVDTGRPSKTYAMVINNASYSKETLSNCPKRCLLLGMDAFGQPIKAIISGPAYAQALLNHSGSINLSGQPRLVKNQQVLVVENVTFNLASKLKSKPTAPAVARPTARGEAAAIPVSYTQIPTDADDLRPGQVIKNRKQIPIDEESELPEPTAMEVSE